MARQGGIRSDAEDTTDSYDVVSILSSPSRNFLLTNDGSQVPVDSLKGKKVGLYFSASWCGPCHRFTPVLAEAYTEFSRKGDMEIVFLSADEDEESFQGYFSKMPWLAVPFSDSATRDSLDELFKVRGIPFLVILDETGKVVTESGVEIIREYGVEGYPFTKGRIKELQDREEDAKRNQTLKYLLVSQSRDFVISSKGDKVSVSELEGKTVGLYFSLSTYNLCLEFTPKLLNMYKKLKDKGEDFEIVMIPLDDNEQAFNEALQNVPWYSLPIKDRKCEKLIRYFELSALPTLVIIGPDGKTIHTNAAETVEEHGAEAYPFTLEKFAELAEIEKAKDEAQTLESVLVKGDRDFLVGQGAKKIPVSELVGKHVLLYFSAHWCPPCRAFVPKLIEAYHKIKSKDEAFEVVFISSDKDQASFEDFFATMPWLSLPYGDERKEFLSRKFKVQGIPSLVALGPTGRTLTKDARNLITIYGADAYPFTEEHIKKKEAELEELTKGWPKTLRHPLDEEHELVLTKRMMFTCDGCQEDGQVWSYYCEECDFDLHPKCALKDEEAAPKDEAVGEGKEGWVCDGDVCYKA
ncbi:hypothetical protein MLD38_024285 [Melastoma candidum]|uniref:Uncharacterized protein n=1 Tax=Melastoma candidum TaxID=119954 RepID=A0ACB9NRU0_9MYRT|nr:hypothetical protein MLD38_024285 [Melastoma candidum]